jgi:hypothetical protein
VTAAEANKIGPDGEAGSGPKKDGNGNKMSCRERGINIGILLPVRVSMQ